MNVINLFIGAGLFVAGGLAIHFWQNLKVR
jgi:hypothetical protein